MATRAVLEIRLLGELEVLRGGRAQRLPQSRKTRALLAYLALTGRPHRREQLCDLLWDVADDRRGALRWSLSKLRPLVDEDGITRLVSDGESVGLELAGVRLDAREVAAALAARPVGEIATDGLERLAAAFRGELLEGNDLPGFDDFQAWCVAERESARRHHALILGELVDRLGDQPERVIGFARTWVRVEPMDGQARAALVRLLGALGRRDEARQHVESGKRLDDEVGRATPAAVLDAWRAVERGRSSQVEAAPSAAPPPAAFSAVDVPIVGRHGELEWLTGLDRRVAADRRLRVAFLAGEPGVGKTHLLRAWLARRGAGATALYGVSYEAESGHPYAAWTDAFAAARAAGAVSESPFDELLARPEPGFPAPAAGRERLFASVARAIEALTSPDRVAALVFDDAQWIDEGSAELLHYVARVSRSFPLTIVLAGREGESADNAPLVRALRAWRRDGLLEERSIGPLGEPEVAALVRGIGRDADPAQVFGQSGGNPLYALELARAAATPGDDRLPSSLTGVVRDRVAQLGPAAADVLRWAAVLGTSFSATQLEQLARIGDEALAHVELLERRALLARAGDGAYRFAHDVVRRVVYADLSEPRRRLMHRRVAELLAARAERDPELITDVAHHATLAHESVLAARACLAAARRALRLFASAEALALARRGLRHADALEEPERTRCRLELLEVRIAARRPDDVDAAITELQGLAERALDLECVEHARLGFHLLSFLRWETGAWSEARRLMLQAEAVSRGADEHQRVLGLAEAARCLVMLERDLGHAQALALEASARGRHAGVELSVTFDALGLLHLHHGDHDQAIREFERARDLARASRERYGEFQALEHMVVLELERGGHRAALALAGQLVDLAERVRESSEAPFARALAAIARVALGDDGAQVALEEQLEALTLVDAKHRLVYVLTRAAWLDCQGRELERAAQRAARALGLAELLERASEQALATLVLLRCAEEKGDASAAERQRAALARLPLEAVTHSVRLLAGASLGASTSRREAR